MSVEELAGLTPFVFDLKCEGYKIASDREENMFRKVAFLSMAPHLDPKSNVRIEKVWPMDIDGIRTVPLRKFDKKEQLRLLDKYAAIKQRRAEKAAKLIN